MKSRMPKIEEGKQPSEEQIKEIQTLKNELGLKKVRHFEQLVKDYKPIIFNNNVFKNVNLAMSAEEIKVEQEKVRELAKYLKESALTNLLKAMQKNEGTPTDSHSMKEFFHQNGVNMRYLGMLANEVKDKPLN